MSLMELENPLDFNTTLLRTPSAAHYVAIAALLLSEALIYSIQVMEARRKVAKQSNLRAPNGYAELLPHATNTALAD